MDLQTRKVWRVGLGYLLAALMLCCNAAAASTYPGVLPPYQLSSAGETLTITSSTMATGSTSSTIYTADMSLLTSGNTDTITVNQGAAMSYNGSNAAGAAIYTAFPITNNPNPATINVNVNGTVTNGTGLYAIYLANANSTPHDTYTVSIGPANTASITGAILTSNINNVTLNLNNSSNITGTINLSVNGTLSALNSIFNVQTSFTPTQELSNIGKLNISAGQTLTLNVFNTNIFSVVNAGTFNVNYNLVGVTSSDGSISNTGTMNIAANISKTGTFTGSGTNILSGGTVATPITVATSSYAVTNHTVQLNNIDNFGNMKLSTSTFTSANFNVTYPSNGYFPGGTLTLLTANAGVTAPTFGSSPSSTMFLTFGPLTKVGNTVQITLTRNPFNTFASTDITTQIGSVLEIIGASSPSTDMVTILNALEQSTTSGQVEYGLEQLAPLTTAPLFGFEIQNDTMQQAALRLAELRNRDRYFAGDIAIENHIWGRAFGSFANQRPIYDSFGYYATAGGYAAGFDRNFDSKYTLGMAGGYVLSHVEDKINTLSNTKIKSYIGMLYGTYNITDNEHLDWVLAITANNFTANRLIDFNSYIQSALSSYSSQQVSVKTIWSEDFEAFNFVQLTPLASAQYTFAKQYSYNETGANGANLFIDRDNSDIVQVGLGAKVAVPVVLNPGILVPEIHAIAFYCPVVGKQNTSFNFIEAGGTMTSIMNVSRTALVYGAALTIAVIDKLEVKVNLDFDIEDRYKSHTVYLNLRYLF